METQISNSEATGSSRGFLSLIRHHARDVKEGGWLVLWRKARKILKLVPFMPFTVPAVIILRLLRPLILVRLGPLRSERIGHFAANTENYLCQRDAGMDNQKAFDVFYHRAPASNRQLKEMWERILYVSPLAGPVDRFNRVLPGGERHFIPWPRYGDRDVHGLLSRVPAHLSFMPEEERRGREELRAMGIPEGVPFICFYSRDSAYLESVFGEGKFRTHDYRDSSIRNHVPAMEEMTRRGYYAVRMGALVKEPLKTTNPMIIDYATNYRSDFMDIYLCARCYFYIGDDGGLNLVSSVFRRPVAYVNKVPIMATHTWGPDNLFIPKKLWSRGEQRFLKLVDSRIGNFSRSEEFAALGVEPVENTPEEITALAVEMDERLKGTWRTTEEDEELQKHFWLRFRESYEADPEFQEMHGEIVARIGAEFLRRNRELID